MSCLLHCSIARARKHLSHHDLYLPANESRASLHSRILELCATFDWGDWHYSFFSYQSSDGGKAAAYSTGVAEQSRA